MATSFAYGNEGWQTSLGGPFTQTTTQTGEVVEYDWVLLNGGKIVSGA